MATEAEARQALIDAIANLAKVGGGPTTAGQLQTIAAAARDFAEAEAILDGRITAPLGARTRS